MLPFVILLQRQNFRGEKKQIQSLPGAKSEMSKMEGPSTKGAWRNLGTSGLVCTFTAAVLVPLYASVKTLRSH